ncbi:MAG: hypothetical protein WD638_00005, partial [Nitriliruptoraceae bacterium]
RLQTRGRHLRYLFVAALEEGPRALAEHVHHLAIDKVQAAASLTALLAEHPAALAGQCRYGRRAASPAHR